MPSFDIDLPDEKATLQLGSQIAEHLVDGLVVYLSGDLGAGKTCLVRGMLQQLGHAGAVKSPTYTLVEDYTFGNRLIYHFDLYRLLDPEELELIGIRDYFNGTACCFVEWPERGKGWLPDADLKVRFSIDEGARRVTISSQTETGYTLLEALSQ